MIKERNKNILIASIIILAVLSRIVPHPPNFAPITGIALFSSKKIKNKLFGVILPIIPLFISDLFIGLSFINIFVYLSFIIIYFLGTIATKIDVKTVFLSSVIFFILTNLGVWYLGYPKNIEGLITCFTLAIPFFINTILGDLFYSFILFRSYKAVEKLKFISA
ncbi:MAG: hypothetical protein EVA36_00825 [Flavobacteriales bacterium]|nr:MAG: hypothetical protein CBC56_006830 [Flavobacteriales bacterium TMED96]RZP12132.1 MAG: hypothetical protein EVA36_00825 [Flavobacteriales bacterium]